MTLFKSYKDLYNALTTNINQNESEVKFTLKNPLKNNDTVEVNLKKVTPSDAVISSIDGIICLHTGYSFVDTLTKFVTKSEFSHASLMISDGKGINVHTECIPPGGITENMFEGKNELLPIISLSVLMNKLKDIRGNNDIRVLMLPKRRSTPTLYNRLKNIPPIPYEKNWITFAKFLLPTYIRKLLNIKESKNSYFCTEYMLNILCPELFEDGKNTPSDFSPGDFIRPFGESNKYANNFIYKNFIIPEYGINNILFVFPHKDGYYDIYKII